MGVFVGAGLALAAPALAAWDVPIPLNVDASGFDQGAPDIARAPGGALYAVWGGNQLGSFDVYFTCSTDQGSNWTAPVALVSGAGDQTFPRVATSLDAGASETRLHLAYRDAGNLAVVRGSADLATPCLVTVDSQTTFATTPADFVRVDADASGNTYFVYRDPSAGSVPTFAFLGAPDVTLSRITKLSTAGASSPDLLSAGADGNTSKVFAAWHEADDGGDAGDNVMTVWSTDGGVDWIGPDKLDLVNTFVEAPSMAFHRFDPPAVYQAYRQGNPGSGIYVRVGSFSGSSVSWSTPAFVAGGLRPSISAFPNIGDALVAWDDTGNVFASSTTNTGSTWTAATTVSNASGTQGNARTAVGSSYVVFESNQDVASDLETFFSREIPGVTGNRVAELRAERLAGKVAVSWLLPLPGGVTRMFVVRDGDPRVVVGETIVPSGLDDEYSVADPAPIDGVPYYLEVEVAGGALEQYGPVSAAPGTSRDGAACAVGGVPSGAAGIAMTLLLVACGGVALSARHRTRS